MKRTHKKVNIHWRHPNDDWANCERDVLFNFASTNLFASYDKSYNIWLIIAPDDDNPIIKSWLYENLKIEIVYHMNPIE